MCKIYRDKSRCAKNALRERDGVCDCRHAVFPCEVEIVKCSTICEVKEAMLEKLHANKGGEGQ